MTEFLETIKIQPKEDDLSQLKILKTHVTLKQTSYVYARRSDGEIVLLPRTALGDSTEIPSDDKFVKWSELLSFNKNDDIPTIVDKGVLKIMADNKLIFETAHKEITEKGSQRYSAPDNKLQKETEQIANEKMAIASTDEQQAA